MKKLKVLILVVVLFIVLGCSNDDNNSGFTLNIDTINSADNVGGRDFGIYNWNVSISNDDAYFGGLVFVIPYNVQQRELLFSGQATVELTYQDSTYYPSPIWDDSTIEDFYLTFNVYSSEDESDGHFTSDDIDSYNIKYINGDNTKNYSISIPYANYITEFSVTDVIEDELSMTFQWDLDKENHYQLLSAQQTGDNFDGPFFSQKLKKSVRKFTFPKEYDFNSDYNNYYSLTEVIQTTTSDLIGVNALLFAVNVDAEGWNKKDSYTTKEVEKILRDQFELLRKPILQNFKLNN